MINMYKKQKLYYKCNFYMNLKNCTFLYIYIPIIRNDLKYII